MKSKLAFSCGAVLAATSMVGAGAAATFVPTASAVHSQVKNPTISNSLVSSTKQMNVSDSEWDSSIKKMEENGYLKQISSTRIPGGFEYSYDIINPKTKKNFAELVVNKLPENKNALTPFISTGMIHWYEPAIVFNQNDQKELKQIGVGATVAMAGAVAAMLGPETAGIGSVIAAGSITSLGIIAAHYVGNHGICSHNQKLYVGAYDDVACK